MTVKQYSYAIEFMKMKELLPHDFRITAYEEGLCLGIGNTGIIVWNNEGKAFRVEPSEDKTLIWDDEEKRPAIARQINYKELGFLNINPSMFNDNKK